MLYNKLQFKFTEDQLNQILRKHQLQAYHAGLRGFEGFENRTCVAVIPPAGGKTSMAVAAAYGLIKGGHIERILYLAPRNSLVRQTTEAFDGGRPSKRTNKRISLAPLAFKDASGGSAPYAKPWTPDGEVGFACNYAGLKPEHKQAFIDYVTDRPCLIICDEFHHLAFKRTENSLGIEESVGEQSRIFAEIWDAAQRAKIGTCTLAMSGTPFRNSNGEKPMFARYVDGKLEADISLPVEECWALGYSLSCSKNNPEVKFEAIDGKGEYSVGNSTGHKFEAVAPSKLKTSVVSASEEVQAYGIGQALNHWMEYRKTHHQSQMIVTVPLQSDAKLLCETFESRLRRDRIRFGVCVSDDGAAGKKIVHEFQDGALDLIFSVGMAYEGLDVPNATHGVYLRGYDSLPYFIQFVNRFTRKPPTFPGKRAYIYFPDTERLRAQVEATIEGAWLPELTPPPEPTMGGNTGGEAGERQITKIDSFQGANAGEDPIEALVRMGAISLEAAEFMPPEAAAELLEKLTSPKVENLDRELYPDLPPSQMRKELSQVMTRYVDRVVKKLTAQHGPRPAPYRPWKAVVNSAMVKITGKHKGKLSLDEMRRAILFLREREIEVANVALDRARAEMHSR